MLIIRFSRQGRRNRVHYRVVLQEHTKAPTGRHIELLGTYDPHKKQGVFETERIKYWMEKGVQVSDSVYNLLIKKGILEGKKRTVKVKKKSKKKKGEEAEKATEDSGEKKEDKKVEKKEATEDKVEDKAAEKKDEPKDKEEKKA